MTDSRSALLLRAGGRLAAGLAGLAASACVVVAALTLPVGGAQAKPVARTVTPVPATATVACPGPLASLSSDGSATALTAVGAARVTAGGGAAAPKSGPLDSADVVTNGGEPQWFQAPAVDATHEPLLAAAQSSAVATADLKGFAAANCVQPDYDQWLVGGATSLGATTLVLLSNPGDVAATVDLKVYTEQGLVQAAGGNGILVQPHAQHVVPLSGLAPNAAATVVHVTSTGGTVSAQLQESDVTGITPQGAEWVGPTAAPSDHVVVPGAVVDTTGLSATAASDAGDGGVPVLRVLPVGDKDAKLTITAKAESGTKGAGMATTVTVGHGVVSEVPLDKLGTGTFTVSVTSSTPVVAAVHTTTFNAKTGTDFAWYAAARPLTAAAAIPVAFGPGARVHFANAGTAAVTVKLAGIGGGSVTVPAGASVSVPKSVTVLTTTDARGLYVSVSYAAGGELAGYVAYPTAASAAALTVYGR